MVRFSLFTLALVAAAPLAAQTVAAPQAPAGPTSVTRAQVTANAEAEFARVDADKNGQMSRAEIENYQRISATARITARNTALFADLDTDKNGQLSAAEFAKVGQVPQARRDLRPADRLQQGRPDQPRRAPRRGARDFRQDRHQQGWHVDRRRSPGASAGAGAVASLMGRGPRSGRVQLNEKRASSAAMMASAASSTLIAASIRTSGASGGS